MLRLDLKVGESIQIGDGIIVTLEEKAGRTAKLAVQADRSIPIKRLSENSTAALAALGGITGRQ